MLILLTSPKVFYSAPKPEELIAVFKNIKSNGNPTAIVSNQEKPDWFDIDFNKSKVQFIKQIGRQTGEIITTNAKKFDLDTFDTLVLANTNIDVQMGKNGKGILIAAGWSSDDYVKSLGIQVNSAEELQEVFDLASEWDGQWWYQGSCPSYSIKSLADLSTYYKSNKQQDFGNKLKQTVKQGGSQLSALLAVTARSLLIDKVVEKGKLVWGVYPSSSSSNDDTEILSDFTHRLRTTTSLVRMARKGEPLFIRHKPSTKRSTSNSSDRNNPSEQIETIHLNPAYKKSLKGKHVIVIDDCTTYGVSFAVASAFLKKAGASQVTGVALGKFGNSLNYYDIMINSDPFSPVVDFEYKQINPLTANNYHTVQQDLRRLIS